MLLARENCSLMEPLDKKEHATSNDDIMTRRLKNRERQRRYRARKRLEADRNALCIVNNSTPPQEEMQLIGVPNNYVARIHCQRDWKKDARRAHTVKEQEGVSSGPVITGFSSANESQATMFLCGPEAGTSLTEFHSNGSPVPNHSERSATPRRRHWKTDARNMKN